MLPFVLFQKDVRPPYSKHLVGIDSIVLQIRISCNEQNQDFLMCGDRVWHLPVRILQQDDSTPLVIHLSHRHSASQTDVKQPHQPPQHIYV